VLPWQLPRTGCGDSTAASEKNKQISASIWDGADFAQDGSQAVKFNSDYAIAVSGDERAFRNNSTHNSSILNCQFDPLKTNLSVADSAVRWENIPGTAIFNGD